MSNRIYVGNLDPKTTEETLRATFGAGGREVTKVSIVQKTKGNKSKSRGFGFVEFGNADQAGSAIESLDGTNVDGREIRVSEAKGGPDIGGDFMAAYRKGGRRDDDRERGGRGGRW